MKIIIAGAGKLGRRIAEIVKDKHAVTVIEEDESRCNYIEKLLAVRAIHGDACDPGVLTEAGADSSDVLVAATGHDEDNLVISVLAKNEFKIKKVIAAVRNPKNQWLYNRSWGVDVALDSAHIMAQIIQEEASLRDLVTLLKLREGEVTVTEITVSPKSKMAGKLIKDIDIPDRCVMAAILRGTSILVPSDEEAIKTGDEILFITHPDVEQELRSLT